MANVALPTNHIARRVVTGVFIDGIVYTVPANMSNDDTLDFAIVPAGARLLGIKAKTDSAIASQVIDIGDGTTVDRFLDGSTAFQTAELVATANEGLGEVLSATADTTLRITFLADAPAATDVITAWAEIAFDDLQAHAGVAA